MIVQPIAYPTYDTVHRIGSTRKMNKMYLVIDTG